MLNITKMANGIRLISQDMPHTEAVAISIWVGTGSRYETLSNNGISHFLEHMAFKGTKTRTAKQIAEEFDNVGGHFNAHTGRESTAYYAKTLKEDVDITIDILADIIQNSIFDKEELERERGVILQELAMTHDTPDDIIFDYYQETAFKDQPLGRSILGTKEFIENVQKQDFENYLAQHYYGENIVIAVAGNIKGRNIENSIIEKFSAIKSGDRLINEPARYNGGSFVKERELEQVHVLLGFPGVSYKSDENYKVQLLSIVLGGGMSSRLFQEVREKRGLAYSVSAFNSSYNDLGLFNIYAGTSPDKTNEYLKIVCNELNKAAEDIDEKELKRAKAGIRSSLLMSQERCGSVADDLGRNFIYYGRNIPVEEHLSKIDGITTKDLQDLLKVIIKGPSSFAAIGQVSGIDVDFQKYL